MVMGVGADSLEGDVYPPQEGGWAALGCKVGGHVKAEHVFACLNRTKLADAAIGTRLGAHKQAARRRELNGHASRGHATLDIQHVGGQRAHAATAPGESRSCPNPGRATTSPWR